jgi:putative photosynthetic complex assembly protein 2
MSLYLVPFAFTLFVWWFTTGAILYLDGLPKRTFPWSMFGATLILVFGLWGLAESRNELTPAGAYCGFASALLVWAWQEVAFLLGFITGPRHEPCPEGSRGLQRLSYAIQAILYHEVALILLAFAVFFVTKDSTNPTGLWTFAVLLVMRQSAKINLFLGVRNLGEKLLPDHLRYIESYFARKQMNSLFPFSIILSSIASVFIWQLALDPHADAFEATAGTLVGSLLGLAILEHLFMILPMPSELLWRWSLRSRNITMGREPGKDTGNVCRSWSAPLPGSCDPQGLHDLLEAGARGAFGDVERINGVARARTGWLHFEMVRGHASVAPFAPYGREEPRVIAIGKRVDEVRLQAAFDACAAPT